MTRFTLAVYFLAFLIIVIPVFGYPDPFDDQNTHETHGQTSTSHDDSAADHDLHFHRHHFGVFLGVTNGKVHEVEHRSSESTSRIENAFTYGVDYEFRFTKIAGAGALMDLAEGELRSTLVAPALFIHPFRGFKLLLAPGLDRHEGHNQFVFRTGIYYDIPVQRFTISPTFALDFLKNDTLLIYGVTVGVGF